VGSDAEILEAAESLRASGVLAGRDPSSGLLQHYVTRGELALMLSRALDLVDSAEEHFSDVSSTDEFFGAVGALSEAGVIDEFTEDAFAPDEVISRQKAARWIMDALSWKVAHEENNRTPYRLSFFEPIETWLGGFHDRGMIGLQYARAVANASRLGIVDASDEGWFYPDLPLTLGDACLYLGRALSAAPRVRSAPPDSVSAESSYPKIEGNSEGPMVWYLQYHLTELKYFPGEIDGLFASHTSDAVVAFQKVERIRRTGTVGADTWQRLLVAETPDPVKTGEGFRVEVDLTRQVLFMVTDNKVWKIIHVSTGSGTRRTRTGHFQIGDKYKGWVQCVTVEGRMYYPSYVVSKTAIHGYPKVPYHPASHGCIRVPVWTAEQIFSETPTGTVVDVYYNYE